tara:strand:- start:383 stop:565 length:183 start_codon:yes stop_codon:yes gene_type:complete
MENEFDYQIVFEVTAKNEDEAFDKFQDMMVGKTDYITPTVRVIKDLNYEAYTGIKPEGTQ